MNLPSYLPVSHSCVRDGGDRRTATVKLSRKMHLLEGGSLQQKHDPVFFRGKG